VRRGTHSAVATLGGLSLLFVLPGGAQAQPAVSGLTPSDVTPKAFSLVWVADEPVTAATVRAFAEPEGTTDLTDTLTQELVSSEHPPALDLGLVKVDVHGAAPSTCFYVQAQTQAASGIAFTPEAPPFPEVCTQARTRRDDVFGQPVTNDLLRHELSIPDGTAPATGALVLLEPTDVASAPISAFVGEGFAAGQAVLNLNAVFASATQETTPLAAGTPVRLRELRGTLCPNPGDQARTRYRRLPDHEEVATIGAPISQVEPPEACFFADTDCSGTVEEADGERVLDGFDAFLGECRFNPDLDTVADDGIDVLDLQRVLNRVGQPAP